MSCFDCVKAMQEAGFASVTVCWVEQGSFILRARRPNVDENNNRFTDEPFLKGVVKNSIIETSIEPDHPSGETLKEASHSRESGTKDSDSDEDEEAEVEVEISSSGEEDDGRDDESEKGSQVGANSGAQANKDDSDEEESDEGDDVAIEVQDDSSDDEDEDVDPEALAAEAAEAAEATKAMAEWARQRAEEKAVAEYKRNQLEKQQQNSEQEEIELIYDALVRWCIAMSSIFGVNHQGDGLLAH